MREKENRELLRKKWKILGSVLTSLVMLICVVWVTLLTVTNIRDRSCEIGILCALGLRRGQILGVFLARSVIMSLVGCIVGFLAANIGANIMSDSNLSDEIMNFNSLGLAVFIAGVITVIACWLPARFIAAQEPAVTLRSG